MHGFLTSSRSVSMRVTFGFGRLIFGVGRPLFGLGRPLFGLALLGFAACGSPPALDDNSFPPIEQTGYAQSTGGGGAAGMGLSAAAGGTTGVSNAGSSSVSAPAGSSGSAGTGQPAPGSAGSGATGAGAASNGACPADIPSLFQRNIKDGGCTNGGACHESGGQKPDLVSPDVVSRLLNIQSSCTKTSTGMSVAPRPYIGKTDSFLEEKIAGTPDPTCGFSMPFFMPQALNAADKKCIVDWIHQLQASAP